MKYNLVQDLVIVAGGAFFLLSGIIAEDQLNIIISGLFFLFGLTALYLDIHQG
jgi:hypothetical protein